MPNAFDKASGGSKPDFDFAEIDGCQPSADASPDILPAVHKLIADRRGRRRHFGVNLFADPAWDILLYLYAAALADEVVFMSALCLAAAIPTATALRWIGTLKDRGLITRRSDSRDRRRIQVQLTDSAQQKMYRYVSEILRTSEAK